MTDRRLLSALLLVLASCAPLRSPSPTSAATSAAGHPVPGGCTAPSGEVVFVADASGRVAAIDVATGARAWTAESIATPLLATTDELLGWKGAPGADGFTLVLLSPRDGRLLRESEPVRLPDPFRTGPAPGKTFRISARLDAGELRVSWRATTRWAGGAPPPASIERNAAREGSGELRVDRATGKVEELRPPAPGAEAGTKISSHPWWDGREWRTDPILLGSLSAALVVVDDGGSPRLRLRRWGNPAGAELPPVGLVDGESSWPWLSADGEHLLVRSADGRASEAARRWKLFDVATGRRLGELPFREAVREISVVGSTVFELEETSATGGSDGGSRVERTLLATDVATGRLRWKQPLEERQVSPLPR